MKSKPFNLLKPMQPPLTMWDKVYNWVTTQARLVLTVVIILITLAFVAKVVVDTEAKNKSKQLSNLMDQLSFYSNTIEPEVRKNIRKVDVYAQLNRKSSQISPVIEEIYQIIGSSSNELKFRIQENRLSIYGSESIELLKNLETALRTSDKFVSVNFDSLTIQSGENVNEVDGTLGQYALTAVISDDVYIVDRLK